MGVLIENMRREGFELSISRPQVILREEDGQRWSRSRKSPSTSTTTIPAR
jgi:predicted membrane GTPase involved in stress response